MCRTLPLVTLKHEGYAFLCIHYSQFQQYFHAQYQPFEIHELGTDFGFAGFPIP